MALKDNKKVLFVLIPVLLGVLVYVILDSPEPKNEDQVEEIFEPEIEDEKKINSKKTAYEEYKAKIKKQKLAKKRSSDSDYFGSNFGEEEEVKEEPKPEVKKEVKKTPKKSIQRKERPTGKIKEKEKIKEEPKPVVKEEPKKEYAFGYGIKKPEQQTVENNLDMTTAILEVGDDVVDGSQLTFINQKEYYVDGIKIEKTALMFGVAVFSKNSIDIQINTIRNPDGRSYNVNLIGYNENYQRGVYYEGKVDGAARSTSNSVLSEGTKSLTKIGAVTSAVSSTVKKASKSFEKKESVYLNEGYRMYFKKP